MTIETKKVASANEAIATVEEVSEENKGSKSAMKTAARFTKEELATEFEIGNLEERFNNAKKLVRYRLNSKGTKCWSVYGVYDNKMTPDGNGGWKSTAKTGWHNATAKVANDMLAQQCGITLVDFVNIEEFMNNRGQATNKDTAEIEQANAQPVEVLEETDGSEEDADEETITAIIPTEDNDYDETDEPEILNADLFVNLYRSPIQERYASVTRSINGEQLYFFHHRLTNISAPALDLEVYFDNGRMNFWHGSKRIARDKVWQVPIIKETTKAQTESFGKFFAGDLTSKFFKVSVYPTFADGSEHNYVRYFDFFNQAQKFVEEVKTFVGDVPTQIYITSGGQYFYTRINGIENYTLPAVDVTEAQSRIDELNKAIADNESFADKCDDDLTAGKLRIANCRNKKVISYYETALRMTEPATDAPTPDKPADKLAQLKAKADAAKKTAAEAKAELVKAQKAHAEAVNAVDRAVLDYEYFGHDIAAAITAHNLPRCELDVKTQTGFSWIIYTGAIKVSFDEDKFKLHCNTSEGDFHLGSYDTPEQVTDVIERLKAAIARGDKDFSFAPETKPIEPAKFQVGATYAGKLPAKIAKKTITVTKISKAFVCFTMKYEKHLLTWRLKLRTDSKTEFVKDECGIFVKASDLVKEMIA